MLPVEVVIVEIEVVVVGVESMGLKWTVRKGIGVVIVEALDFSAALHDGFRRGGGVGALRGDGCGKVKRDRREDRWVLDVLHLHWTDINNISLDLSKLNLGNKSHTL